jgi:hypothetical protein
MISQVLADPCAGVELVRANIDTGSAFDGDDMAAKNSLNGPCSRHIRRTALLLARVL